MSRWKGSRCLAGKQALVAVADALVLGGTIFGRSPSSGALGERLAQNTPDRSLPQPVLIAQGDADDLVLPEVQSRWVAGRCRAGQALDYRRYPGRDHLSLVAQDSAFDADVLRWTEERFGGQPFKGSCPPP